MLRTRRWFHSLPLLLVGACASSLPTTEDYYRVLPDAFRFVAQDGVRNALGATPDGPLMADLRSFEGGGYRLTRVRVDAKRVLAALGPGVEPVPRDSALLCDNTELNTGCWVRQYGSWVRFNTGSANRDVIELYLASSTTDRRSLPTGICDRVWRLRYERRARGWTPTQRQFVKATCAE